MSVEFDCRSRFTSQFDIWHAPSLFTGMYLLLILASLLPYKLVLIHLLNSISGTHDRCLQGLQSRIDSACDRSPAVESTIFVMAGRASNDGSFAAALESDPLHSDADASGAENLPLVPPGSLSPIMSSPSAGLLQFATSSDNDEHVPTLPSASAQQPPTRGDGVYDPEQVMSLSASGSTGQDSTARAGRQGQDPQDRNLLPPAPGTTSSSLRFN
jgi:hypothetical protein